MDEAQATSKLYTEAELRVLAPALEWEYVGLPYNLNGMMVRRVKHPYTGIETLVRLDPAETEDWYGPEGNP